MSQPPKKLPPVRRSITVPAPPERAFAVFTGGMNAWWPAEFTPFPREAIVIEPKPGGRWYETGAAGREGQSGKVLAWEAPRRVLFAWQIDGQWKYDPNLVTELEVRFTGDGNGGTRVDLEHRDLDRIGELTEAAHAMIDSDEGWTGLLRRYATEVTK